MLGGVRDAPLPCGAVIDDDGDAVLVTAAARDAEPQEVAQRHVLVNWLRRQLVDIKKSINRHRRLVSQTTEKIQQQVHRLRANIATSEVDRTTDTHYRCGTKVCTGVCAHLSATPVVSVRRRVYLRRCDICS